MGRWTLTFGYFIPGVRHFTAYAAGMSDLKPHVFAVFAYSGALIWVSTFITLGYVLGERWAATSERIHTYALITLGIAIACALAYLAYRKVRYNHSNSGSRRLP